MSSGRCAACSAHTDPNRSVLVPEQTRAATGSLLLRHNSGTGSARRRPNPPLSRNRGLSTPCLQRCTPTVRSCRNAAPRRDSRRPPVSLRAWSIHPCLQCFPIRRREPIRAAVDNTSAAMLHRAERCLKSDLTNFRAPSRSPAFSQTAFALSIDERTDLDYGCDADRVRTKQA